MASFTSQDSFTGNQAHGFSRQHNGNVYNISGQSRAQHNENKAAFWDLSAQFARLWNSKAIEEEDRRTREILASLTYETIDTRWEAIPEAAANTFEWLLSATHCVLEAESMSTDSQLSGQSSRASSVSNLLGCDGSRPHSPSSSDPLESPLNFENDTRELTPWHALHGLSTMPDVTRGSSFRTWLEQGYEMDLFWISGAAGSGKSTLMKFISEHDEVEVLLQKWASKRVLNQAYHFFWASGTDHQRSYKGMLRSLLYQLCLQRPSITRDAFPERWAGRQTGAWSLKELWLGLKTLTADTNAAFCFFIDGLDEYYPDSEHLSMAQQLLSLATLPNVKICVSSRSWEVFNLAFGQVHFSLKLEDVNTEDLTRFAQQKLEEAREIAGSRSPLTQGDICRFVDDLVWTSQGVFLWVHLIVADLTDRILLGASLSQLTKCLEVLPSELEQYFAVTMFDRIKSTYKKGETMTVLQLALLLEEASKSVGDAWPETMNNVETYWLALETKCLYSLDSLLPEDAHDMGSKCHNAKEMTSLLIEGCSGGFLIVHRGADGFFGNVDALVQFAHRSMRDFFRTENMLALLARSVPKELLAEDMVMKLFTARAWMVSSSAHLLGTRGQQLLIDTAIVLAGDSDPDLARLWRGLAPRNSRSLAWPDDPEIAAADWLLCQLLEKGRYGAVKNIIRQEPTLVVRQDIFERLLRHVWSLEEHEMLSYLLEHGLDARSFARTWIQFLKRWLDQEETRTGSVDMLWKTKKLLTDHGVNEGCFSEAAKRLVRLDSSFNDLDKKQTSENIEAAHRRRQEIRSRLWPTLFDPRTNEALHACWNEKRQREVLVRSSWLRCFDDQQPHTLPIRLVCKFRRPEKQDLGTPVRLKTWCVKHYTWEIFDGSDAHALAQPDRTLSA